MINSIETDLQALLKAARKADQKQLIEVDLAADNSSFAVSPESQVEFVLRTKIAGPVPELLSLGTRGKELEGYSAGSQSARQSAHRLENRQGGFRRPRKSSGSSQSWSVRLQGTL